MTDAKFTRDLRGVDWVVRVLWLIAASLVVVILVVRGDGVLTEGQLVRAGFESSAAAAFTVPLASTMPAHSLDAIRWNDQRPVLIKPGKTITVPSGSLVTISGWAFDTQNDATFVAVGAQVDHRMPTLPTLSAVVHLARPDVAHALRNSRAHDSGFAMQLDTGALGTGRHEVVFRALATDRRSASILGPPVAINVTDPRAAAQNTDAIDAINGVVIGKTSPESPVGFLRAAAGRMNISGWCFVTDGRRLATSVTFIVDGLPAATARPSLPRPDVARAYHDGRLTRTGFEGTLQTDSLAPGQHEIHVLMGMSDGTTVPGSTTLYVSVL